MGLVLILVMLLFILPTYNLAQSYQSLQEKKRTIQTVGERISENK